MNLAILSGKGGTGKTTVATNLAVALGANYMDCDVEEPNGFIFLNPSHVISEEVSVLCPVIDSSKCNLCRACAKVCQFNALIATKKAVLVYDKLCHSCGACEIACPEDAIGFRERPIGVIEKGRKGDIICTRGVLNVGEPMAVPVIKNLLENAERGINILDCSPGTSCNVVSTLQYADGAILVTEPTVFGLHDLKMAVKLVKDLKVHAGVVINKYDDKDNAVEEFCREEDLTVLGKIPYKREAAEYYSRGKMLFEIPEYNNVFTGMLERLREVFSWS